MRRHRFMHIFLIIFLQISRLKWRFARNATIYNCGKYGLCAIRALPILSQIYIRHVPIRVIHKFTLFQAACLARRNICAALLEEWPQNISHGESGFSDGHRRCSANRRSQHVRPHQQQRIGKKNSSYFEARRRKSFDAHQKAWETRRESCICTSQKKLFVKQRANVIDGGVVDVRKRRLRCVQNECYSGKQGVFLFMGISALNGIETIRAVKTEAHLRIPMSSGNVRRVEMHDPPTQSFGFRPSTRLPSPWEKVVENALFRCTWYGIRGAIHSPTNP
ncbi:hypothetical protein GPALN_006687 [Globodera pallida]|nr:hypothetical protein GPALN_006687 [Globodera pallida]